LKDKILIFCKITNRYYTSIIYIEYLNIGVQKSEINNLVNYMSNDFINKIASDLQKNGKNELAMKWSKLAQDAGSPFNPNIANFARSTESPMVIEEPKKVQHSYQVTIEGPAANMNDIEIMNSINKAVNNIDGDVQVKGYQFLFKKEI
jgi:uncharacterized radical SAM superfamily Fe-S cluster-containing enzyme